MRNFTKRYISGIIRDYYYDYQRHREDDVIDMIKYRNKDLAIIRSYEEWALEELIRYICENDKGSIIDRVEEFRKKMDDYACKGNYAFSIAYDVTTCILDYLIYCGYH